MWVLIKKIGIFGIELVRIDEKVKVYLEMECNNWYGFFLILLIFLFKYFVFYIFGYFWLV